MRELAKWLVLVCLMVEIDPAQVKRVIDGDTFILYSFDVPPETRVRVVGVNTPERGKPNYKEATDFTRAWLSRGPFTLLTCDRDSLQRRLGTISRDGERLDVELIKAGLGVPFHAPQP